MFKCDYCDYTSKRRFNIIRHVAGKHVTMNNQFGRGYDMPGGARLKCDYCDYTSKRRFNIIRHVGGKHVTMNNQFGRGYDMQGAFDKRLKENFKLFISGPSTCGKTVFVSKLLENMHTFAKLPPTTVIYLSLIHI